MYQLLWSGPTYGGQASGGNDPGGTPGGPEGGDARPGGGGNGRPGGRLGPEDVRQFRDDQDGTPGWAAQGGALWNQLLWEMQSGQTPGSHEGFPF